jgi:hypothetical protein
LPVAERFAKHGDMKAQAPLFDHHIRPDPSDEVSLIDHRRRMLDQRDENVERATPQVHGDTISFEEPLRHSQTKRAELNDL